jgi:hypothetical protein
VSRKARRGQPHTEIADVHAALSRLGERLSANDEQESLFDAESPWAAGAALEERDFDRPVTLEVGDDAGETVRYRLPDSLGTPERLEVLRLVRSVNAGFVRLLTPEVVQTVDRGVRSSRGWQAQLEGGVTFLDPVNRHTIELHRDLSEDAMLERVQSLNPRVADTWRLLTAEILEAWEPGVAEPPPVWVDVATLLAAMGFTKASGGGYRPRDIETVARALEALDSLWVVRPEGTVTLAIDPETGQRKKTMLQKHSSHRVLVTMTRESLRTIGGKKFPLRWQIRAGDWIKGIPREVAPILRALVELPAGSTVQTWAKAIGMEIGYLVGRHRGEAVSIKVKTLLERAGLLTEVEEARSGGNAARGVRYFDEALDVLEGLSALQEWRYHPEDVARLEGVTRRDRTSIWLASRVMFVLPAPAPLERPGFIRQLRVGSGVK